MRFLTAKKISEILAGLDPLVVSRSVGLPTRKRRVDKRNIWLYDVTGLEGTYRVRIKAVPKSKAIKTLAASDVLISCSCPYWRWQGPEHWAKLDGYLYGRPRGTASNPVVRDPRGTHHICKHALVVLNKVQEAVYSESKQSGKPILFQSTQ